MKETSTFDKKYIEKALICYKESEEMKKYIIQELLKQIDNFTQIWSVLYQNK